MRLKACFGCLPAFRYQPIGQQHPAPAVIQNAAPVQVISTQVQPIPSAAIPTNPTPNNLAVTPIKPDPNPNREFQQFEQLPLELQEAIIRHLNVNEQIPFKLTSNKSNSQVCKTYDECRKDALELVQKIFKASKDSRRQDLFEFEARLEPHEVYLKCITTEAWLPFWDLSERDVKLIAQLLNHGIATWLLEDVMGYRSWHLLPIYRALDNDESTHESFFSILDYHESSVDLDKNNVCVVGGNFDGWRNHITIPGTIDVNQILVNLAQCFSPKKMENEALSRNVQKFLRYLHRKTESQVIQRRTVPEFDSPRQAAAWFKKIQTAFQSAEDSDDAGQTPFFLIAKRM